MVRLAGAGAYCVDMRTACFTEDYYRFSQFTRRSFKEEPLGIIGQMQFPSPDLQYQTSEGIKRLLKMIMYMQFTMDLSLQWFDTGGWAKGRAFGLQKKLDVSLLVVIF